MGRASESERKTYRNAQTKACRFAARVGRPTTGTERGISGNPRLLYRRVYGAIQLKSTTTLPIQLAKSCELTFLQPCRNSCISSTCDLSAAWLRRAIQCHRLRSYRLLQAEGLARSRICYRRRQRVESLRRTLTNSPSTIA